MKGRIQADRLTAVAELLTANFAVLVVNIMVNLTSPNVGMVFTTHVYYWFTTLV